MNDCMDTGAASEPITLVNLRLKAVAHAKGAGFAQLARAFVSAAATEPAAETRRSVYFGPKMGELVTRVISRGGLLRQPCAGPAIVEEFDTTVVIPPDWRASVDVLGNIVMHAQEGS